MKKSFKLYVIAWLAVLALFNVVAFVIPSIADEKYNTLFWVSYASITVCFFAQLACTYYVSKKDSLQKLFYTLPLIRVNVISLIAMLICGGVCMAINVIPSWIGIILCCAILTFSIVASVKTIFAADTIAAIDQKIKTKTLFIKMLTAEAESLIAKAQGDDMVKLANKVYEAVRYSDPMSNEALASVEEKINTQFADFSKAVAENNAEEAQASSQTLLASIVERNTKCKFLK